MTAPPAPDGRAVNHSTQSVQEQLYPGLTCFGCGPGNAAGLGLRSYAADGAIEARFQPRPEHDNGAGYLNGGIAATLIDCHSAAAVYFTAHQRGWIQHPGSMPYVTAGLEVAYRRPAPLGSILRLTAAIAEAAEAELVAEIEVISDGKVRSAGRVRWQRLRVR
jgi:uncharacterized protein (TIGR00369 family)